MHVLVAGWFSFEQMGATAGDIMACNVLCDWLQKSDISFDVAYAPPFVGGLDWRETTPAQYSYIFFVCGPFGNGWPITDFLDHFSGIKLIGLNLTLLQSLEEWNPFALCYERDSSSFHRPDITFASTTKKIPVVGIILAHKQKEYGVRSKHPIVDKVIADFISSKQVVRVNIDTCIENNEGGLKTAEQIESLIAKMDVVITTRLHGVALSIKNGVPVIAIDAVEGGAKVSLQARSIQWPLLFSTAVSTEDMEKAFAYCLTNEARILALKCADEARRQSDELGEELMVKIKEIDN
jgi:hypothetical protein